jgi:hypothetical protein
MVRDGRLGPSALDFAVGNDSINRVLAHKGAAN